MVGPRRGRRAVFRLAPALELETVRLTGMPAAQPRIRQKRLKVRPPGSPFSVGASLFFLDHQPHPHGSQSPQFIDASRFACAADNCSSAIFFCRLSSWNFW